MYLYNVIVMRYLPYGFDFVRNPIFSAGSWSDLRTSEVEEIPALFEGGRGGHGPLVWWGMVLQR